MHLMVYKTKKGLPLLIDDCGADGEGCDGQYQQSKNGHGLEDAGYC